MDTLYFWLIWGAVMGAVGVVAAWTQSKKKKTPQGYEGVEFGVDYAVKLLKSKGCPCKLHSKEKTDEGDELKSYTFSFQGGDFYIEGLANSVYTKIVMPNIGMLPMEDLVTARILCNMVNSNAPSQVRLEYYLTDDEKNVGFNVVMGGPIMSVIPKVDVYLERNIEMGFNLRNSYSRALDVLREEQQKTKTEDVEEEYSSRRRELYLLRECELNQYNYKRVDVVKEYLLPDFLNNIGLEKLAINKVVATANTGESVAYESEELAQVDVFKTLLKVNSEEIAKTSFKYDWVNLVVTGTHKGDGERSSVVNVFVEADGETEHTLYARVTVSVPGQPVSESIKAGSPDNKAFAKTFVIAFDKVSDRGRVAEVEYMRKDAYDKLEAGKTDELTDEQALLLDCEIPDAREELYFGRKLFNSGRYYEAIVRLLVAYTHLRASFDHLSPRMRETFGEVCYMLGFCFAELQQYEKALYYLEIVAFKVCVKYDMEYINCLVNSGDVRAMGAVMKATEQVQKVLSRIDEEDSEMPDIERYNRFLLRRRCYLLIEKGNYDEAEALLKPLVDDPRDGSFAMRELSYIQRKREEKGDSHKSEE